jgi:hypothetical protein
MVAKPKIVPHTVTTPKGKVNVLCRDVYEGTTYGASTVGVAVGLKKGSDPDAICTMPASDAIRMGFLGRVTIRHQKGSEAIKSSKIYCAISKMDTALGDLHGTTYLGSTVNSAIFPQRTVLR